MNLENKNIITFEQLGDALRYGILTEISQMLNISEDENDMHFWGSIAYLYLNGYISNATAENIFTDFLSVNMHETSIEEFVGKISESVFSELLNKYCFNNLDDLVDILNKIVVPEWYFNNGKELVKQSKNGMFLYEDYLYYIAEDVTRSYFIKIYSESFCAENNFSVQYGKTILGYGYSKIYGFDEKLKRVYLKAINQEDFYHYYDMVSDLYTICSEKFLSIKDGIPYVLTEDGYLAYILYDEVHKIRKYSSYEKYIQNKDGFIVFPKDLNSPFFTPYCVTYNGDVVPAGADICKEYIWDEMEKIVQPEQVSFFQIPYNLLNKKNIPLPSGLTLDSIIKTFKSNISNSELCSNKKFIIFEGLCSLLAEYISTDEDITELLYELYNINHVLCKDKNVFPSENLYWRFKEISVLKEDKHKINEAFINHDYEKMKKIVLGSMQNTYIEKTETGLIGVFKFGIDGIESKAGSKKTGTVVGNMMIYETNLQNYSGKVSYDCINDCYYIISDKIYSKEDKLKIVKDFKLTGKQYIFVVQK